MSRRIVHGPLSVVTARSEGGGTTVDGMLMWWDLDMDPDGDIILSCAPNQFRDYLPKEVSDRTISSIMKYPTLKYVYKRKCLRNVSSLIVFLFK
jgi:hypothetical protein